MDERFALDIPALVTVSPDGADAKRLLHRINSPEDGEFIPLILVISQIIKFTPRPNSPHQTRRPVE